MGATSREAVLFFQAYLVKLAWPYTDLLRKWAAQPIVEQAGDSIAQYIGSPKILLFWIFPYTPTAHGRRFCHWRHTYHPSCLNLQLHPLLYSAPVYNYLCCPGHPLLCVAYSLIFTHAQNAGQNDHWWQAKGKGTGKAWDAALGRDQATRQQAFR